ncbi:MAG: prepilin-type N-terminal cleavage/methylation domain-containing protein [Oceanospirillaceae bacterium]
MTNEQGGFTLVELITVMVLIGILSTVAFSRFADTDLYRQALFSSKLQSYIRVAQQMAMAQQTAVYVNSAPKSLLALQQTAQSQWQITIANDTGMQSHSLELNENIQVDKQLLPIGVKLVLKFAANGDLVQSNYPKISQVTRSIALQIGEEVLCIAPTGYSYEGSCI